MKVTKVLLGGVGLLLLAVAATTPAGAVLFSTPTGANVGGNAVSATANFSLSGSNLTILLTNNSPADGKQDTPTNTLSGLTFQVQGQSSGLSPTSATGTIFQGNLCNPGPCNTTNVGGEWGYQLKTTTNEIASAGYITTGAPKNIGNFNGANLDNPISLDGINFAILSATHDPLNGGLAVPLVMPSVSLLLGGFSFTLHDIFNVNFLYGTQPEAVIGGSCPPTDPTCNGGGGPPPPIPEPATLFLLGSALLGFGITRRRKRA